MGDTDGLRQEPLSRIEARRSGAARYLTQNRPSVRRRSTITIVLSSLAAVFTAGPAIGGEPFAESVQDLFGLASDSYVWWTLCLLALLVSIGAAVVTNLAQAHEAALNRLTTAEAAKAELEGLADLVRLEHLGVRR